MRVDNCCGKANEDEERVAQRAALQNLAEVLRAQETNRLMCTDNFYTSIPLSHKLQTMRIYLMCATELKQKKAAEENAERFAYLSEEAIRREWVLIGRTTSLCAFLALGALRRSHMSFVEKKMAHSHRCHVHNLPTATTTLWESRRTRPTTFTKQLYSTIYQNAEMLQGYTFGVSRHCNGQRFHRTQDRDKNTREESSNTCCILTATSRRSPESNYRIFKFRRRPEGPRNGAPSAAQTQRTDEMNGIVPSKDSVCANGCSAYAGAGVRSYENSYFCPTCLRVKNGRVTLRNKPRHLERGISLTCDHVSH
ncbi:LOW QUALITY PROTEIN: hypothetical protein PHMEG_00027762 [Phytophthora megakarya]|uniref:PiggyBac transposable element-derived protein domain-containing protein n=1 Tax=Phytophthora megakarya TaxID=4795 RepID=A0A225V6H5_9STRA|nr:LOW QUALITY PROTEIN: hypothetical protein PHMEG_00027762 [Phytophthora megakarya]